MTWTELHTRIVAEGLSVELVQEARQMVLSKQHLLVHYEPGFDDMLAVLGHVAQYLRGPDHKGVHSYIVGICKNPDDDSPCRNEICCIWRAPATENNS